MAKKKEINKKIETAETVTPEGAASEDDCIVAKKKAKDSVFCDLFEDPKYLFQLYQALHPEDHISTIDDIGNVTIRNVLVNQMYNDLGFTVGKDRPRLMILLEAQSTWTENIVIRIVMYLANTWKEYIESHKLNVYGEKKIDLPKPEFFVLYTDEQGGKPDSISMAEEFFGGDDSALEAKVRVIYGGNEGNIIDQYVAFTRVYNEQVKLHGRTREAILETIRLCKDRNVLKEYLSNREKEVVTIMMQLFDQEYAMERYGDEREANGEKKGRVEGRMEEKKDMALSLAGMGLSVEKIAEAAKVSVGTVRKWLDECLVTA